MLNLNLANLQFMAHKKVEVQRQTVVTHKQNALVRKLLTAKLYQVVQSFTANVVQKSTQELT